MPIVLNMPGFLIYQSSEYDRVIQVENMPE